MTEQTIKFQRTLSTALCLIRDGLSSKTALRAALDLSPLAVVDLIEELKSQEFIIGLSDPLVITSDGRRAVSHLQLVKCVEQHITFIPTAAGKRQPVDCDGTVHFVTCPVYVARLF